MTKKAKAAAKTRKATELANAFLGAIKNGRLFDAFSQAGRRFKVGEELDKKISVAYEQYLKDPENKDKLKALEALELKVAESLDYTTADGDPEILKALDHHNDLDPTAGLHLFDLCRRGVATQTCQPLIKTIKQLHTTDY